jgi:2-polyprenyl-6-methoxyphenol hydroxylase-like FAD-dependent oxidoreductase
VACAAARRPDDDTLTTTDGAPERRRIAVVGGSLGGLFAAALLKRDGHRVTVFERSSAGLSRRGAGLVAQQELFDALRTLGLEQAAEVGVVARERITLDRSGRTLYTDPTPQTQVSWDFLYEALRRLLTDDEYLLGRPVTGVRSAGGTAEVVLDGDEAHRFDLVVGADGANSVVRSFVAPGDSGNRYVGYSTWRGLIPEHELGADAARTLLDRFAFFTSPRAHMLGYLVPGPLGETFPGERRYNWVWYRRIAPRELAEIMERSGRPGSGTSLAPGDLPESLRVRLASDAMLDLPPQFAAAVRAEPAPFLQAVLDYVAPTMTAERVVLIGDAAAVVRPHTAMGAAKAAGDALALTEALRALPIDEALRVFDRDRLHVARSIAAYGRRLGQSLPLAAR